MRGIYALKMMPIDANASTSSSCQCLYDYTHILHIGYVFAVSTTNVRQMLCISYRKHKQVHIVGAPYELFLIVYVQLNGQLCEELFLK